ncbi:MAG: hypothetical protein IKP02_04370 [Paludibacteraceae bacterium]|nr:hypothetical protein [Paludibacteraceae bacterium]MBR4704823.1 hypothetical protein [Paludibacteraceae bacterium]
MESLPLTRHFDSTRNETISILTLSSIVPALPATGLTFTHESAQVAVHASGAVRINV